VVGSSISITYKMKQRNECIKMVKKTSLWVLLFYFGTFSLELLLSTLYLLTVPYLRHKLNLPYEFSMIWISLPINNLILSRIYFKNIKSKRSTIVNEDLYTGLLLFFAILTASSALLFASILKWTTGYEKDIKFLTPILTFVLFFIVSVGAVGYSWAHINIEELWIETKKQRPSHKYVKYIYLFGRFFVILPLSFLSTNPLDLMFVMLCIISGLLISITIVLIFYI
jgi:uncharacterized membrane protein